MVYLAAKAAASLQPPIGVEMLPWVRVQHNLWITQIQSLAGSLCPLIIFIKSFTHDIGEVAYIQYK